MNSAVLIWCCQVSGRCWGVSGEAGFPLPLPDNEAAFERLDKILGLYD